jgi:hypothetical protein
MTLNDEGMKGIKKPTKEPFIMRIPLFWCLAVPQKGCAPKVAGLLWYLSRCKKRMTFTLTNRFLSKYGIDRKTKGRALATLERAGLISVERRERRNPVVTMLPGPSEVVGRLDDDDDDYDY